MIKFDGETTNIYINNFTSNVDCMNDYGEYFGEIIRDSTTNLTIQFNMTTTQFILTMTGRK